MRKITLVWLFTAGMAQAAPQLSLAERNQRREDGRVLAITGWTVGAIAVTQLVIGGLLLWGAGRAGDHDDGVYGLSGSSIAFLTLGSASLVGALPLAIVGEVEKSKNQPLTVAPMLTRDVGGAQLMWRY